MTKSDLLILDFCRNIEFSQKEVKDLINKYPLNGTDKAKEYFLIIRSIVRTRKSLRSLVVHQTDFFEDMKFEDSGSDELIDA